MAIKGYQILSKLLILVLVVYTLVFSKDIAFAQKSNDAENRVLVEAIASVDKDEVTIGDKIKFVLRVKYKGEITLQFPEVGEQIGVFAIREIIPPVDVPTSFKRLIVWISVGMGLLLLSGVICGLVYKFKKRSRIQEQTFIKRTPHEIAYELLERLSKEDLIAKGLVKEYYYRITNILRHYI